MLSRRRLGAPVLACLVSLTGGSAALGGSRFFTFQGTKPGDQLGIAVAGVQDVDHDGFDDIVVGAWQTETGRPGYAQVRSGRTGEVLFQWTGSAAGDLFGKAVAGAGDVNQDGYPDVLVGAPFKDGADFNAGAVDVYSGQDGKELYEFDGRSESDKFGSAVSAAATSTATATRTSSSARPETTATASTRASPWCAPVATDRSCSSFAAIKPTIRSVTPSPPPAT
jgi:hypothetical protein